jgi:hypothetical protein
MPPSAEDCRAKAFECAELAAKTRDPFSKLLLEQTAEQWFVLAEGAEKYDGAAILAHRELRLKRRGGTNAALLGCRPVRDSAQ